MEEEARLESQDEAVKRHWRAIQTDVRRYDEELAQLLHYTFIASVSHKYHCITFGCYFPFHFQELMYQERRSLLERVLTKRYKRVMHAAFCLVPEAASTEPEAADFMAPPPDERDLSPVQLEKMKRNARNRLRKWKMGKGIKL